MSKVRLIAGAKVGSPKSLSLQILGETPPMGSLQIFLDDEAYVAEMAMAINGVTVTFEDKDKGS